jgi:MFS transporter, DHA1 family, tetracycline resistance protein
VFRTAQERRSFVALLLTYALEYFGYLLVVPLLPSLILNLDNNLLPIGVSEGTRIFWVGLLLGLFGVAQFIAAPILGAAADRFGCKRLLMATVAGSVLGHALVAAGIYQQSLMLLLVGRLWSGFCSAGMALSQAAVSRLVVDEHRSKAFGYLMGFGALGGVLGPLVGGYFAFVGPFRGALPLLIGCVASILNFVILMWHLREEGIPLAAHAGPRDFLNLLGRRTLRGLLVVLLFFFLARAGYSLFFSTYLAQRYSLGSHTIGYLYAYMGAAFLFFGVMVNGRLTRYFSAQNLGALGLIVNGVGAVLTVLCVDYRYLIIVIPICSMGSALAQPNIGALLARTVPATHQGRVFGISSSLWSLSQATSPFLAGICAQWGYWLPIALCAALYLLAGYRLLIARDWRAAAQSLPEE